MRPIAPILLLSLAACGPSFEARSVQAIHAADASEFWSLPIPSDLRIRDDGSIGFLDWPTEQASDVVSLWLAAAEAELRDGWGLNSGVFLPLSGAIDPASLPKDGAASLAEGASVYLVDISPESPDFGQRLAIETSFDADGDAYGPANLITAVPVPGHSRRPGTRYALVATSSVVDHSGAPMGPSQGLFDALHDKRGADPVLRDHFEGLAEQLEGFGQEPEEIAGLAVFTTMDNSATIRRLADWARGLPEPQLLGSWQLAEDYEHYTVLTNEVPLPVIQAGERPYANVGEGLIQWDGDGLPRVVEQQNVRLSLTIPKQAMPASGFPISLFMHGSGGHWYQAIDRGPREEIEDAPDPEPGSGPAHWLAQRGVATMGFDFSLHGNRHNPPDTTGLVLYNITGNPQTTVHNFQVAVMELVLLGRVASAISLPADLAEGLNAGGAADGRIRMDGERLSAIGQSMGTTLGMVWATVDTNVKGLVFSGAGGLLTEIATKATEPFDVRPMLELLTNPGRTLTHHSPLLNAFQNLWDYVDPTAHARHLVAEPHAGIPPKAALVPSGVRDGYFHPRAETGFVVAMEIPMAGPSVEPIMPASQALKGLSPVSYPVRGNLNGKAAAVTHWDAPHDLGHYVIFNKETARYQYSCFVASVGTAAAAVIPEPSSWETPCP